MKNFENIENKGIFQEFQGKDTSNPNYYQLKVNNVSPYKNETANKNFTGEK